MKTHPCTTCGHSLLISALEVVIPTLCPACGPVYAFAKNVSKNEAVPSNVTAVAGTVCGIFLLFAGARIIDDLFFS